MRENYFDGEWRPVTDQGYKALEKLRSRGFELGNDRYGKLMARWPSPAAPLTFEGIPLDYWREEVRLDCAVSLARLRSICAERGADFDRTIAGLKGGNDGIEAPIAPREMRIESPVS